MTASQATKAIQTDFDRITFLNPSDIRTIEDQPATVVKEISNFSLRQYFRCAPRHFCQRLFVSRGDWEF
jgi:hypothetical protein